MVEKPIWQLSASELVEQIARREVTAEAAVTATVERMRAVNGHLNAVVDDLGDEAIEQAHALDANRSKSELAGPLHGVPVTIKVNVDQKGKSTTNASPRSQMLSRQMTRRLSRT